MNIWARDAITFALSGALLLLSVAAPTVASAQEQRFDGVTLRVGTYGGTWRDAIHDLIGAELERRGATIEYVIGNPRDNLMKLIAARGAPPPFDVMELTDAVKGDLLASGFAAKLNYDNLPNAASLSPDFRDEYTVATWTSQEGIVFNTEKYAEIGLSPPRLYTDLLDPQLQGRVSFPDINVGGAVNAIIGFAAASGGSIDDITPGLEAIRRLDVTAFSKSSVDLAARFQSGDVWAAPWHAGYALRMRRAGVPVTISYPEVGDRQGMLQLGWIARIEGAREAEAAEFFINRYLSAAVAEELAQRNGVGPLNQDALAKLAEEPILRELMMVAPGQLENAYHADWSKIDMSVWVDRWNRVMSR